MEGSNLIPFAERTEEQQRDIRIRGGKKSGEVRRKKKAMKELLRSYLQQRSDVDLSKTVGEEYIAAVVANMLMNPSVKDLEIVTRILGELVEKSEVKADVKGEVKARLFELPKGNG